MDPSREREERIQASIKEREREVKMSRTAQEKEWGRERDQLRKTEAVQHFKALLVDMVREREGGKEGGKEGRRREGKEGQRGGGRGRGRTRVKEGFVYSSNVRCAVLMQCGMTLESS